MAKYDWQRIEQEYVTGEMPLIKLADRYKISQTTIYKHAKEAKFEEKRQKYREKVAKKALSRASTRDGKALGRLMTGTERAIRELRRAITDDTLYGYIVQEPAAMDEETGEVRPGGLRLETLKKADTKAIVNLSTAIRNLAVATRVMYPEGSQARDEGQQGVIVLAARDIGEDDEE